MKFHFAQSNHLGNRKINQDRFEIIERDGAALMVLADGMGGRPHGEMAAQVAIDVAGDSYHETVGIIEDVEGFFERVIANINRAILELAEEENMPRTPGTTVVLALLQDGHINWAHVGDSRLYLLRDEKLFERTSDHSQVEALYREGRITKEQQQNHPELNQITRCVGCQDEPPEVTHSKLVQLAPQDIILLCSDGMWGAFSDDEIIEHMSMDCMPLAELTERLASMAEQRCYPNSDNVSVITLKVDFIKGYTAPTPTDDSSQASSASDEDSLQSAINQLEQVMAEYEDELKLHD